ncbi:MAG: c-type cytochrome [Gallionella sp.]
MSYTQINFTLGAIALLFAAAAFADENPDQIWQRIGAGDPGVGKFKSTYCQTCHGLDGNSTTSSHSPKLAGQYAAYIQKQINNYKDGSRQDPVMTAIAMTLVDNQEVLDISAYFASQKQMKGARTAVNKNGQTLYMRSNGCVSCHGVNGKGLTPNNPSTPVIGGQHKEYLKKQLRDFKDHARTNEASGMMEMMSSFMSEEEMEDVASYVSGL